jgi:hypothetical protein
LPHALLRDPASELPEEEQQGDGRKKRPIFVDLRNVRELERGSLIAGVPVSECAKRTT